MLDYDSLIAPFDGETPCGPDLRAEPEFRDIEDAPGDFGNQKAPELLAVIERCDAFLQRTKDQAPALVALQAAVRVGDFALANAALALVKGYAEEYWEDFHPGPAEDMAIARVNELTALARPAAMTLPIQRAAIAKMPSPSTQAFTAAMVAGACSPAAEWSSEDESALAAQVENGHVSAVQARTIRPNREGARLLRTIMRVLSADARAADSEAGVGGEDLELDADTVRRVALGLREQVARARDEFARMSDMLYDLNAVYDQRAGDSASLSPVFAVLKTTVGDCERFLATFPEEEASDAPGTEEAGDGAAAGGASGGGTGGAAGKRFISSVPQSRADSVSAINAVIRFFEENEPTSPVPLMLRRVRAWIEMDFIQLLNEIAPNAVDDARTLLAYPEESAID
jgi:type VI secretion system protein ImpA